MNSGDLRVDRGRRRHDVKQAQGRAGTPGDGPSQRQRVLAERRAVQRREDSVKHDRSFPVQRDRAPGGLAKPAPEHAALRYGAARRLVSRPMCEEDGAERRGAPSDLETNRGRRRAVPHTAGRDRPPARCAAAVPRGRLFVGWVRQASPSLDFACSDGLPSLPTGPAQGLRSTRDGSTDRLRGRR